MIIQSDTHKFKRNLQSLPRYFSGNEKHCRFKSSGKHTEKDPPKYVTGDLFYVYYCALSSCAYAVLMPSSMALKREAG